MEGSGAPSPLSIAAGEGQESGSLGITVRENRSPGRLPPRIRGLVRDLFWGKVSQGRPLRR